MKSKRSKWSGQGEFFIEMLIVNNWWSCLTIFWRKAPLMEDNFHPSIDHLFTAHDLGLDKPMDQFPIRNLLMVPLMRKSSAFYILWWQKRKFIYKLENSPSWIWHQKWFQKYQCLNDWRGFKSLSILVCFKPFLTLSNSFGTF